MNPPTLLAIDLGTSNTVAVLHSPDGRVRPLLFEGSPLLPSSVYATESRELVVGRDALHLSRLDPARFEPHPKRRIDDGWVLLGTTEVPVTDLLAAVFGRVVQEAVRTVGALPPAVLTYPAAWGQTRRSVLLAAAAKATIAVDRIVAEPVAAATYFTTVLGTRLPAGAKVAVFDFGGGTLDVAVLERTGAGLDVVAFGGLDDLGGLDVDAAIIEHVGTQLRSAAPQVWQRLAAGTDADARRDNALLWIDARAAKEMLTRTSAAAIHIPGYPAGTHLTRAEFDAFTGPLLHRAVAETARVLQSANTSPRDLAGLFLVGGSSRIPLVAQLLHRQLGVAPTVLEQPEIAVAEGALRAVLPRPVAPARPVPPLPPGPAFPVSVPPGAIQPTSAVPAPPPAAPPIAAPPPKRRRLAMLASALAVLLVAGLVGAALLWTSTRGKAPTDTPSVSANPETAKATLGEPVELTFGGSATVRVTLAQKTVTKEVNIDGGRVGKPKNGAFLAFDARINVKQGVYVFNTVHFRLVSTDRLARWRGADGGPTPEAVPGFEHNLSSTTLAKDDIENGKVVFDVAEADLVNAAVVLKWPQSDDRPAAAYWLLD